MLLGKVGVGWQFSYLGLSSLILISGIMYFGILYLVKEPQSSLWCLSGKRGIEKSHLYNLMHYKGMAALAL